jgi:hypothetical protein
MAMTQQINEGVKLYGQLYAPERAPGTHWIGGWVGPTAGLDAEAKKIFFAPAGNRIPVSNIAYYYLLTNIIFPTYQKILFSP